MPRIGEDFLDSVLYLYRSRHEAKEGINIGGSGFLVSVAAQHAPGLSFVYAVTNRHVIEKADVIRFNTKEGLTHAAKFARNTWIESKTDDLAIRPINATELPDSPGTFVHKTVNASQILSRDRAEKIKLGIGDDFFMVGRFINHEGKQQNAPLVRYGSISQMPAEPISYSLGGQRHDQICIMADVRSIGGFSGSPVFLNELIFTRPDGGEVPDRHWLIGIDCSHIPMWSPVCGIDEEPIGQTQVNVNSGMAGIIPAWILLEMLMSDDLITKRARDEKIFLSASKSSKAVPDFGGAVSSPAGDENPNAREDFMRLASAAARKQKSTE